MEEALFCKNRQENYNFGGAKIILTEFTEGQPSFNLQKFTTDAGRMDRRANASNFGKRHSQN